MISHSSDDRDALVYQIAVELDRPNVYMGGPRRPSLRTAEAVVQIFEAWSSDALRDKGESMISESMGALLWRRVYEEKVDLSVVVHINADTLRSLLTQAGIPEPENSKRPAG